MGRVLPESVIIVHQYATVTCVGGGCHLLSSWWCSISVCQHTPWRTSDMGRDPSKKEKKKKTFFRCSLCGDVLQDFPRTTTTTPPPRHTRPSLPFPSRRPGSTIHPHTQIHGSAPSSWCGVRDRIHVRGASVSCCYWHFFFFFVGSCVDSGWRAVTNVSLF